MFQLGIDNTAVSDTCDFKLGQLGMNDGSNIIYKWVQYDTGAGSVAAVSGNVATYYTLDGYKNNQVSADLSDSLLMLVVQTPITYALLQVIFPTRKLPVGSYSKYYEGGLMLSLVFMYY